MKYEFDYSKLKGRVIEKYGSYSRFLKDLNMSMQLFNKRVNNITQFNSSEIKKISQLLEINDNEITTYFFTEKVEKTQ